MDGTNEYSFHVYEYEYLRKEHRKKSIGVEWCGNEGVGAGVSDGECSGVQWSAVECSAVQCSGGTCQCQLDAMAFSAEQ